jgi:pimeloyl-ACP methyl ester carboxylesterase
MANIVLVPGGFHGGWYFSPILADIRKAGHNVHAATLTGLGDRAHLGDARTNLDTHIQDVITLIEHEKLEDVIILGHSYGGMVISGVADRLAGRIKTIIYLDALVPEDGDSIFKLMPEVSVNVFCGLTTDGITAPPPPGLDPRACAHPLASFLQPVRLGGAEKLVDRKIFVWCAKDSRGPFGPIHDRLKDQADWEVTSVPYGHDIMNEAPETVLALVLATAEGRSFQQ